MRVKPRLVLARQKPGGRRRAHRPREAGARDPRRETAITMRQMMEGVVLHGTGKDYANLQRLHVGRQNRIGADLRFQGARLHAPLQRELPGLRAGGESADRDRGDAERDVRRQRGIWRSGGGAGVPRGGDVGAADAGCAQGSAGHQPALTKNDKRDDDDLAIAGLGAAPVELADATRFDHSIDMRAAVRSRSVSSVTPPPVQGASSASASKPLRGLP